MKIGITNVRGTFYATLDINTIEEIIALQNEYGHALIIDENCLYGEEGIELVPEDFCNCEYAIEVYDDYIE